MHFNNNKKWHDYNICMDPDFLSEIVRFIDVFSHLNKLSTLQNKWMYSVVVS